MIAVFDSSSLLSLSRYYLPNDRNKKLYDYIKEKLCTGEIIIIDKILQECRFVSGGIVFKSLDFLDDKNFCKDNAVGENTDLLIPVAHEKVYRMVDSNFVIPALVKDFNEAEYEVIKESFIKSADFKIIVKAYNLIKGGEDVILVTEETASTNDRKPFKKIPLICNFLKVKTVNIQEYMELQADISIEIK